MVGRLDKAWHDQSQWWLCTTQLGHVQQLVWLGLCLTETWLGGRPVGVTGLSPSLATIAGNDVVAGLCLAETWLDNLDMAMVG
jgi:hypothetical protein